MNFVVLGAAPILSNIILALSAMFLLMLGIFKAKKNTSIIYYGAMISILLALLSIPNDWFDFYYLLPDQLNFADDQYTRFVMVLLYLSCISILYGTYRYMSEENISQFEYPILMLFSLIGMTILLTSNDRSSM